MADRQLKVSLIGDTRSLDRALGRTETRLQAFGKSAAKSTGAFGKLDSKGLFAGGTGTFAAAAGATVLIGALKKSVDVASNLNEQINKTQVVFGDSAKAVLAWSKTSATAFGLAQDQALEAVSTFGNLLSPLGVLPEKAAALSKELVQLSGDLASFNNADPKEVLLDLRSGIVGESEPLRKYGILLSVARVQQEALTETGKNNVKALTNQEKVLARYNLILQDSAAAQGDFARTSDGLANKQRITAAKLRDLEAQAGKTGAAVESLALGPINDLLTGLTLAATGVNTLTGELQHLGNIKIPAIHIPIVGDVHLPNPLKRAFGIAGGQITGAVEGAIPVIGPAIGPFKELKKQTFDRFGHKKGLTEAEKQRVRAAASLFGVIPPGGDTFAEQLRAAGFVGSTGPSKRPKGVTQSQRNNFFDSRVSRELGRVQDIGSFKGQIGELQKIAAELRQRLAGTKDKTRRLTLEDELLDVQRRIRDTAASARDAAKAEKELADSRRKAAQQALKEAADKLKTSAIDRLQALQSKRQADNQLQDARDQLKVARQIGGPQGIKFASRDVQDALIQEQITKLDSARVKGNTGGTFTVTIGSVVLPGVQNAKQLLAELQKMSRTSSASSRGKTPGTSFFPGHA